MKNKIVDLRNHLFETIEMLKDKTDPMPIERAQAIANVGKVIVDSAKVEVQFMKAAADSGLKGTGFLEEKKVEELPPAGGAPALGQPRLVKDGRNQ